MKAKESPGHVSSAPFSMEPVAKTCDKPLDLRGYRSSSISINKPVGESHCNNLLRKNMVSRYPLCTVGILGIVLFVKA